MSDQRDLVLKANLQRAIRDPLLVRLGRIAPLVYADPTQGKLSFLTRLSKKREKVAEIQQVFERFDVYSKGM